MHHIVEDPVLGVDLCIDIAGDLRRQDMLGDSAWL